MILTNHRRRGYLTDFTDKHWEIRLLQYQHFTCRAVDVEVYRPALGPTGQIPQQPTISLSPKLLPVIFPSGVFLDAAITTAATHLF